MVNGLLKVNNYGGWLQMENSCGLCTENDSGEFHNENYRNWLQMVNDSGWFQMEKVSGR